MNTLMIELTPELAEHLEESAGRLGLDASELARALLIASLARPDNALRETKKEKPMRSIMELHGLGAEIWKDEHGNLIDAQEYVNELRKG